MKSEIEQNTLSYSTDGPRNLWPSISNYVLKVSSPNDSQEAVVYMYFFDSGGGSYPEVISSVQVKWFQQKSQEINPDSRVPEIIFWHIPSQAYKKVASKFYVQKHCVGSIFLEDVAAQEAEMGIMKVLEQRPSVKATTMDWTGAAHTRSSGYALLVIPVTVGMETGQEELEFWKSITSPSLSSHGLGWKTDNYIVKSS
ncbi:putative inactive purple acid phosphatase 16 [Sesamum angolense]|uniref:Inactive purple acid phosphatase 16 n=1 Tax=Sesamum angolense TaxID=2727404 RepID=A0AAE1X4T6_9LAMI|nr:putative inactive purple acid phosphatase 16 [Sesamum angolense]